MNFKRFLRHSNTLNSSFVLLTLGLVMVISVTNDNFKGFGICLAFTSLIVVMLAMLEIQSLFWRSQFEWWEDDDGNFEYWQEGNL